MRGLLLKALAAVAALLVVGAIVAYGALRRSLPVVDGRVTVAGLAAPVEIVRDADAIPHIVAESKHDALVGLGYVHAQDRLWQMEFQRRIGYGRLSEIFGPVTLPQDRFLRTVGFGRAARDAWARMPDWAGQEITAYTAGVNAFLAANRGTALPPEFALLRFEPEPWQGADVIVWAKMMAWDLSNNYSMELLRDDIARLVGLEKLGELMPPDPRDGLSILSRHDMEWTRADDRMTRHVPTRAPRAGRGRSFAALSDSLALGNPSVADWLLGGATTDTLGSNNWVVDGTMTASGKPLLANDPHLDAHIPSIWYLAHLSAGDFDVIGATLPGTPAVAIGRNRSIAWGETNLPADVEDLYRERLDPTGRFAEFRGQLEPLQIVPETIAIKGAEPVQIAVRISRHGPLVSDAINANNAALRRDAPPTSLEPLALRWTALDPNDTTIQAFLRLNDARTWRDFTAAMRLFVVPPQNFVYADAEGHIGYYPPGRVPVRARADGSVPVEGWTGVAEWTGWIPFDDLPHTVDPPEHFVVTANNRPAPAEYPYFLGGEWTEPYRAHRIVERLRGATKLTPTDFAAIQADTRSLHAAALVPALVARARPSSAADEQALAIVRQWDGEARGDSAASAIFQAWFHYLTPALVGDELGPAVTADYLRADRTSFVARFVADTIRTSDNPWCDDVRTPTRETCEETVSSALHEAVADLTRRLAGNLTTWRWDAVHLARFPHQGLDAVPVLRWFLSRSIPSAGDWSTVNVGAVAADHPFDQHAVPGYRQIVDLSAVNDSRFLDAVGQSGHPLSPHYDDFLQDWRAVTYRPMRTTKADIEAGAIGHLWLVPR